jgi:hypothetical protein
MDYEAVAALAALVTVAVAALALWYESKRSRFSLGVELYMKLDERFNSNEMRNIRKAAAKSLLSGRLGTGPAFRTTVEDVLDFFEMIGFLLSRGALDERMVWHGFFNIIHPYWLSAQEYIEDQRREDPTVWSDLAQLHQRLLSIEKTERKCSDADLALSKDSLTEFLYTEFYL